jgi:hypothetical protein
MSDNYLPKLYSKPEHKFTFGLWTEGKLTPEKTKA